MSPTEVDRYVEVAVAVPLDRTFDYALESDQDPLPGVRVLVPHGGRQVVGFVLARKSAPAPGRGRTRSVLRVLDSVPVLPAELCDVILRASRDALAPPGLALAAAVPPGTTPRAGRRVVLLDAGRRALARGEARGSLGSVLWALGKEPLLESRLRARFPAAVPALERLERIGWIRREDAVEPPRVRTRTIPRYALAAGVDPAALLDGLARAPRQRELVERLREGAQLLPSGPALRALLERGLVVAVEEQELVRGPDARPVAAAPAAPPALTPHQREAVRRIVAALDARQEATFLLHGITGSGKTEVYLGAAARALETERGVIVLVPEISLTHQVVDRFRARFGERVAVLHSGLSAGERFDQWRRIRDGGHRVAIGARSAVFAPFADPALIVIDEEHDPAYKGEEGFRYHARDVAELRSRSARCPLVLGSATPDLETLWRAQHGLVERLMLPERVARRPLPRVEIVDLGAERRRSRRVQLLTQPLRRALAETLAQRQQAILFLNRRGFATYSYCFACGHALRCKHCDIALVYHATLGPRRRDRLEQGDLRCHYCGYREDPQPLCPACGSEHGALGGSGTERLEEELGAMFPHARVLRLDRDTSARRNAQSDILRAFHQGEADVLVGTQMVAKGHDVPGVTLVGVVLADLGLHFPDFRAGERTFQLLCQVAGRAGRGDDPGRVVIQTFLPQHYAIAHARTHDYEGFAREELRRREPHGYPPFRALLLVALSGADGARVESAARAVAQIARSVPLAASGGLELLGPAPAPIARVRDRFRWQLLLLGEHDALLDAGRGLAAQTRGRYRGVDVRLVPAPLQML
jgi:primosomal protein N' (replication factor Y)